MLLLSDWWDVYVGIGSITSTTNGTLMGFGKGWPGVDRLNEPSLVPLVGARWYALNLLSELDQVRNTPLAQWKQGGCITQEMVANHQETEYYIDRSAGIMYFWPPAAAESFNSNMHQDAFVSMHDNAVHIQDTSYVTLSDLVIAHSRLTGVNATGVSNVWIRRCRVSNTGANGIDIAGYHSGIVESIVQHVGCSGVRAGGGNWTTLTPGRIVVHNNTISNFSRWKRTYMPGLVWGGVGNNYTANRISHGPHNGVFGGGNAEVWAGVEGGNDCLFEDNWIDHVAYEAEDSGGFYTCGQAGKLSWKSSGTHLLAPSPVLHCYLSAVLQNLCLMWRAAFHSIEIGWAFVNRGNILRRNTFSRVAKDLTSLTSGAVFAMYFDVRRVHCPVQPMP